MDLTTQLEKDGRRGKQEIEKRKWRKMRRGRKREEIMDVFIAIVRLVEKKYTKWV